MQIWAEGVMGWFAGGTRWLQCACWWQIWELRRFKTTSSSEIPSSTQIWKWWRLHYPPWLVLHPAPPSRWHRQLRSHTTTSCVHGGCRSQEEWRCQREPRFCYWFWGLVWSGFEIWFFDLRGECSWWVWFEEEDE